MSEVSSEVLSDLIEVGIPSLVAITGTIVSLILALKGHKKDLLIEKLKIEKEFEKERVDRKGALVSEISSDLSKLHNSFMSYGRLLNKKINLAQESVDLPSNIFEQLTQTYNELVENLRESIQIESKTRLLGNREIRKTFESYQEILSGYVESFTADTVEDVEKNERKMVRLTERYESIFKFLSKIYLVGETQSIKSARNSN